jgi:hypothetical protein
MNREPAAPRRRRVAGSGTGGGPAAAVVCIMGSTAALGFAMISLTKPISLLGSSGVVVIKIDCEAKAEAPRIRAKAAERMSFMAGLLFRNTKPISTSYATRQRVSSNK